MKLSIVITAYNVEPYINTCIDSIFNQKLIGHGLEVILVEDCSTDNTLKILEKYDNIKIVSHKFNQGAGLSRRHGIEVAKGDYIMLLDGDDYLENPNHLQTLLDKAKETDADIVSGGIKILKEDGSYDITSYGNTICSGYDKLKKFWGERIVFMNNKIIKKSLHEKYPYCHRRYIEDTPVIIPMMWKANKVVYVDTVGYVYRMREASLTHTTNPIKDVIYKGLCWLDLIDFFLKNDAQVLNVVNIIGALSNIINLYNKIVITSEMVASYKEDWDEFIIRLQNRINILNVDIKGLKK